MAILKYKLKPALLRIFSFCFAVLLFAACAEGDAGGEYFNIDGSPKLSDPEFTRNFPPVVMSGYVGENVVPYSDDLGRSGSIDLSSLSKGYVVAAVTSPAIAKFQVVFNGQPTTYNLDNTGKQEVFPLTEGNGHYTFIIFLHYEGDDYEYFLTQEADVTLESEFAPFLIPNQIVNYTQDSSAVQLSHELTQNCSSDLEVIQMVYYWVKQNIVYDTEKATSIVATNDTTYLPNLEEVLQAKKGICYDYAALVAAMLRSNGIPCKLIIGRVLNGDTPVEHAWNMIWTAETGWFAVQVPSKPGDWERVDLTFAASDDPSVLQFIGDGENYTAFSQH